MGNDFKEKETRSNDLKTMVGPIYSSGKIEDNRKHNFTQGYEAPMTRERKAEQMKLVQKYFLGEKQSTDMLQQKIVDKAENLRRQYSQRSRSETRTDTKISREEALKLGEERRKEAVERRKEFLKSETESTMKKSTMQMTKHEKMDFQQQRFDIQQRETKEQAVQLEQVKPVVNILNVEVKTRRQIEMERDEMIQKNNKYLSKRSRNNQTKD